MFNPARHSWRAPWPCFINVQASLSVTFRIRYAKAAAQLFVYVNGKERAGGSKAVATEAASLVWATVEVQRLQVQAGDEVTIVVKLTGEERTTLGTRWGFSIFDSRPADPKRLDYVSVSMASDFVPGALVRPQDWLPDMSQKECVKTLIGLCGLSQHTDEYLPELRSQPTALVLQQLSSALDWSARLDYGQPAVRHWP